MNKIGISQVDNGFIVKIIDYDLISPMRERYDGTKLYVFHSLGDVYDFIKPLFRSENITIAEQTK